MNIVRRTANLNLTATVLTPLTVILTEAFWVYPWLLLSGKWPALVWQRPLLSLASLILLLSISYFVTRFLLGKRWPLKWIRSGMVLCGLAAIFLVIRIEYSAGLGLGDGMWFVETGRTLLNSFSQPHPLVIAIPICAYLWWRGISLGRTTLYTNDIYRSFMTGIASLVILTLLWWTAFRADTVEVLASTIAPYVAAFFFFGLCSLALSNLQAVQQRILPEDMTKMFNRRWLPILFGIAGGIVLAAIGITSLFSPEFVAFLGGLGASILEVVRQIIYYLLIPLGYLAAGMVYIVRFIINLLRGEHSVEPFEAQGFTRPEGMPETGEAVTLPEVAIVALKWTLFAVVSIIVILLVARAIRRYHPLRAETDVDEINESLWSWEGFKADLRLFFSLLLGRLKRKRKEITLRATIPRRRTEKELEGILGIRELYRRLLYEASNLGVAYRSYETPYEYAARLGLAVPDSTEQMEKLTELYVGVRYGDVEVDDSQVNYANNLWRLIKDLFSRIKSHQDAEQDGLT